MAGSTDQKGSYDSRLKRRCALSLPVAPTPTTRSTRLAKPRGQLVRTEASHETRDARAPDRALSDSGTGRADGAPDRAGRHRSLAGGARAHGARVQGSGRT